MTDALGGLVLGWGVAAGIHLLFGSPGGRPTSWQLEIALAQVGINATDIRLAPVQPLDGSVFECRDADGQLTLVNQLTVSYIPAAPGWFATQHLLKHDYL